MHASSAAGCSAPTPRACSRVLLKFPDSDEDRWQAADASRDVQVGRRARWSVS